MQDVIHVERADTERQRREIRENGFCIIKDALFPAQTDAMLERLEQQADAELAQGVTKFDAPEQPDEEITQWVAMLPNKGSCFLDMAVNPPVYDLARHFIGEECIVSDLSARITKPGSQAMNLHTDQWWHPQSAIPGEAGQPIGAVTRSSVIEDQPGEALPAPARRPIPPMVTLTTIYALVDIPIDMGPTRFVRASHLSGKQPDPNLNYDDVAPEVARGSAVVFDGRTWHGAAANVSDKIRYTTIMAYTGPQFRPILNFPFGLRSDVAASLTDAQKKVLGFKIWNGYGATNDFSSTFATPGSQNIGELT